MKELMNEIQRRFFEEIRLEAVMLTPEEIEKIYLRISSEVYLENLSQLHERLNG